MIEILLRVKSDNPLQLSCVCKLWKSLLVDPRFMENHILRSTTDICDLLNKALEHYHAFKLQYITNNLVARQEDGPDDEEIHSVVNAFDDLERLSKNVEKIFEEKEEKKHGMMKRIAQINPLLVVVRYVKENLNTMRDIMQNMEDRVKCHQNCLRIYLKSKTSPP